MTKEFEKRVEKELIVIDEEDDTPEDMGAAGTSNEYTQSTQNANPLFISQTGDNSNVITNYGTITINFGKK